ncbi:MAG: undecaprenyl-diphosphatase UppP [Chloroflexi bacterium]|nr:undecaprenyl-diphosphatase UppP [Chloroflexota bacterium]
MNVFHALILGIVQGLTEFIPVSSTAHLFIASSLLGLPSDERLFVFYFIIQLGTVAALLLFFWHDYWDIVLKFFEGIKSRKPFEEYHSRLGWLVIVATIPAGLLGLALKPFVQNMSGEPLLWAGVRLLFTALLLTAVEYFDKKSRTLESATWIDALSVGLFQVLAIFPGASRSGSTMAGAMFRGFDRPSAARFAFLMSAPILLAAGLYETVQAIILPNTHEFLPILITGFVTSAIVGWLAIRWLMAYLRKHSLYVFSIYCLVAGVVVLLLK